MCVWGHSVHTYAVCDSLSLRRWREKSRWGKTALTSELLIGSARMYFEWWTSAGVSWLLHAHAHLWQWRHLHHEKRTIFAPPSILFFFSYRVYIPLLLTNTPVRRWRRWQWVGEKGNMKYSSNTILFFFFFLFACPPPPSSSCGLWEPRQV